eukprot:c892_g1_i1 orf=2-1174(-)
MVQQAAAPSLIPCTVRSYHLDKLTGPNYLTWATRVTLLLKRASLWDIVDGSAPQPAPNAADLADWKAKDLQAQAELMLHLGDRQVQMVRRCQTSAEISTFLRRTYHHEDLITRVTTLKKLLGSALGESQDTIKFVDEWPILLDNALLSGLQLDESLQSMLLLAALPSSWRPFITTQASVVGLTIETLITRILQEDAMRTSSNQAPVPLSTQYLQRAGGFRKKTFHRFQSASQSTSPSSIKTCRYCGRQGHVDKDCRTKKRDQQRNNGRPRAHTHQLNTSTLGEYGMETLQLFTASFLNSVESMLPSTDAADEWLLHTGATHHMTPHRHWLQDYKKLNEAVKVYLGDNHCLHARGIGNMPVTLPSGSTVLIKDIYHIPGLSRNLLSVTQLPQ